MPGTKRAKGRGGKGQRHDEMRMNRKDNTPESIAARMYRGFKPREDKSTIQKDLGKARGHFKPRRRRISGRNH